MPDPPPVITTTLPLKSIRLLLLWVASDRRPIGSLPGSTCPALWPLRLMTPKRLAFDLQVEHRDVIAAEVRNIEQVKVRTTESAVRGLAQKEVLGILTEQSHAVVRRNSIDAVRSVGRDMEVSLGVERQPIRHSCETLGVHLRRARCTVLHDFNA